LTEQGNSHSAAVERVASKPNAQLRNSGPRRNGSLMRCWCWRLAATVEQVGGVSRLSSSYWNRYQRLHCSMYDTVGN